LGHATPFSRSPSSPLAYDASWPVFSTGAAGLVPVKPVALEFENVFPLRTSSTVAFPVASSPKRGITTTLFCEKVGGVKNRKKPKSKEPRVETRGSLLDLLSAQPKEWQIPLSEQEGGYEKGTFFVPMPEDYEPVKDPEYVWKEWEE
jgi:hypothetical protein